MMRKTLRSFSLALAALAVVTIFNEVAQAGPPLLCRPMETGNAESLPWSGAEWRAVKADYDINRLVDDTLRLLTPDTPVLARMETLRRATIYAAWSLSDREVGYHIGDLRVANELFARLKEQAAQAKGESAALALFDLGYYVESYKQATSFHKDPNPARSVDGYALVIKAINLRGSNDPVMEFAAAVITTEPRRAGTREHLRKAVMSASADSLLARNLVNHFNDKGRTVAELRAYLGSTKN